MINIYLIKDIILKSYRIIPDYFIPINMMIVRYIPILAVTLFCEYHFKPFKKFISSDYSSLWVYGLVIMNFMVQMSIPLLITRMIMFHEHPGDNLYKTIFTKMNFRMIGFILLFIGLILVLVGIAGGIVGFFIIPIQYNMQLTILSFVGASIIGVVILYIIFKMSLVPQIIASENKIGFRQSHTMMKSQTLNMLMIFIVVMMPLIIIFVLSSVLIFKYLSMVLIKNMMSTEDNYFWMRGIWQVIIIYLATIPNAAYAYLYKYIKDKTLSSH